MQSARALLLVSWSRHRCRVISVTCAASEMASPKAVGDRPAVGRSKVRVRGRPVGKSAAALVLVKASSDPSETSHLRDSNCKCRRRQTCSAGEKLQG